MSISTNIRTKLKIFPTKISQKLLNSTNISKVMGKS